MCRHCRVYKNRILEAFKQPQTNNAGEVKTQLMNGGCQKSYCTSTGSPGTVRTPHRAWGLVTSRGCAHCKVCKFRLLAATPSPIWRASVASAVKIRPGASDVKRTKAWSGYNLWCYYLL